MEDMSFEQALQTLETIVRKLEEGNMPLDESVKAYERGIRLKKFCDQQLRTAQLKIEEVMISNDKAITKPFEIEELDARLRALLRRSAGQVDRKSVV